MRDLLSLGDQQEGTKLSSRQAFELVSDPKIGQTQVEDDAGEGIFDASDRLEEGQVITWWNDIEKDKRWVQIKHLVYYHSSCAGIGAGLPVFRGWVCNDGRGEEDSITDSVQLLRPAYPGQMATIRHNIFNVVLVLDFAQTMTYEIIAGQIAQMIQRGVPIRWGIVPMFDNEDEDCTRLRGFGATFADQIAATIARIMDYSIKTLGRGVTRDMMLQVRACMCVTRG